MLRKSKYKLRLFSAFSYTLILHENKHAAESKSYEFMLLLIFTTIALLSIIGII